MDLICVFKDGSLVEHGKHNDLVRGNGVYAGMWEKQADISIANAGNDVDISVERLRKIPLFSSAPQSDLERERRMLRVDEGEADPGCRKTGTKAGRFYILTLGIVARSTRRDTDSTH